MMIKAIKVRSIWLLIIFFFTMVPSVSNLKAQSGQVIDSLTRSLAGLHSPREEMDILYYLVEEWAELNFDSSHAYAVRLLQKAEQSNDEEYIIYGYRMIGVAYDYSYQPDSARHYYQLALDNAYQISDTLNIAIGYFNLGTLELLSGNYIKVLPLYDQAIEYFEDIPGSEVRMVKIFNNLGVVYRRINRYEDAIRIYSRALEMIDGEENEKQLINIYINLGNALISIEQHDSARYYFQHVYDYAIAKDDLLNLGYASNGLGVIAAQKGNYQESMAFFGYVLGQPEVEDQYVAFTSNRFLAAILSMQGNFDSAMYYFKRAISVYEEREYPDQVKELYLQLAEHYERTGEIGEAIAYYKKYYGIKDRVINQEVINRTAEWEERFKNQEKETEIINLKLRSEEASLLAQRQKNQLNIFIFLSMVLVTIVGFSFYMYRLKQRVNKNLETKNLLINKALADKELLMKEIHHRVKNNLQVISSLLNLQSNFIVDEKANAAVTESKNRVHSMALIHQRLYQYDNLTEIDLEEYLDQLIQNLEQSYYQKEKEIVINLEAEPLMMDVDKVILLGLIVNELITNSFKYAFEGKTRGVIDVSLKREENEIILTVADDGKGMKEIPEIKKGSLGTLLINDLSKKLNGELQYDLKTGTSVTLRFNYQRKYS